MLIFQGVNEVYSWPGAILEYQYGELTLHSDFPCHEKPSTRLQAVDAGWSHLPKKNTRASWGGILSLPIKRLGYSWIGRRYKWSSFLLSLSSFYSFVWLFEHHDLCLTKSLLPCFCFKQILSIGLRFNRRLFGKPGFWFEPPKGCFSAIIEAGVSCHPHLF